VLYALGSDGDLACINLAGGEIRWSKNLRSDFGGEPGKWAYAESPLVDGEVVVCTPGGKQATLVALNKKSGETIWKCAVPGGEQAAYSSIIIVEAGGMKQYVQFLQRGLVGVDAKTGKVLWRYDRTAQGSPANIPTAVAHDNYVYSSTGRGGGGLVELKTQGDAVKAEQIYYSNKLPTSIGGSVELNGFLYGTNSQGLMCVEFKTGAIKWQSRGVGAGSICYADGRFYVHGEKTPWAVALVEASSANYVEKGRFKLPDPPEVRKGDAWAYPVVANGHLYIRDVGSLWCYDVQGQVAAK
jgi:outer membrane protein assembly factor BamB